jgi:hypothetical protein
MCFKNNKSAFQNHDFVDTAIAEIVNTGCAIKVPFQPYVVSPLSVTTHKSGKKRLILFAMKNSLNPILYQATQLIEQV